MGLSRGRRGLWGGFGLLKTPTATFRMFTSRTDEAVVVVTTGRPLLLSPANPEAFVQAITDLLSGQD